MASIKEIRTHIKSVEQTLKITNAMYLIATSNLRKARKQLNDVRPYFEKVESTIADILYRSPEIRHRFFDKRPDIPTEQRKVGYIVVTGDKGLAGAYNHNILKLADQCRQKNPCTGLYVVGQVGRVYFAEHGVPIDGEFLYTAQDPNVGRASDMAERIAAGFVSGELDEIHILFTRMVSAFRMEPTDYQLLPLVRDVFPPPEGERERYTREVVYLPSVRQVMDYLVPSYLSGVIFGALVESYCSEQNARMTAMKTSSDNAREMLKDLNLVYNRARQSAITQEITEVVGGAGAQA